jgi:hypothetical protein
MELQTWHNDSKLKAKIIRRLKNDHKLDRLVKGQYWENGKGCAVGCTIRGADHSKYETELGIPVWLARLEDNIFEGLPNKAAQQFAIEFPKAIAIGVSSKSLELVKWKFCAFILKENIERVLTLEISDKLKKQVVDAIRAVLALHTRALDTGTFDAGAAWSARSAAWSAEITAESTAYSAAYSAAESAAESARSAAESARSAAWSAAESARGAAWSAAYERYANEILRLLKEVK